LGVKVEYKSKTTTVKIKDSEPETSEEDVKNAVVKATDTDPSFIKLLPSFGGNKMFVIELRSHETWKCKQISSWSGTVSSQTQTTNH